MRRFARRLRWLALTQCLVGLGAALAAAHAVIVESSPKPGEAVRGPDVAVRLVLNSRIDRARSSLRLQAGQAEPAALSLLEDDEPNTLKARASGLAPGEYRLLWQTLSVDGHVTRGQIPFRVLGP